MNRWWMVGLAVAGAALLIAGVVWLWRRKKGARKTAPRLSAVWERFQKDLPIAEQRDPLVVVLGERLAGKSRVVQAGLALGGPSPLAAPNAQEDARLTLYAGRQLRVQELSGELLEDTRPESRDALSSLWGPLSLEIPLVVAVLDAHAPSWSPVGLRRLGALVRDQVDLLGSLRGTPPRVRVVLTHLDEAAEGFVELASVAETCGYVARPRAGHGAAELSAWFEPPELSRAVGWLSAAELGRAARFAAGGGPRLLAELAPFLEALLSPRSGAAVPKFDGLVLAALPEFGATALFGDPLALQGAPIESDTRALDRKRALRAGAFASLAAALLLGLYAYHYRSVGRAADAVRQLAGAVERAKREPQKSWPTDGAARAAEVEAAARLDAALAPLWPPLRLAYPARKSGLSEAFLQQLRELYLVPVAQGPDRVKRIYALSLLYATQEDALGQQIQASPEAWAAALEVPASVVHDYLLWSQRRWTGTVALPATNSGEVAVEDWQRWLDQVDAALGREKITPAELAELQRQGGVLSDSVGGALDVRGLEAVIRALRGVRGDEVDAFIGKGAIRQRAAKWVSENWETLEAVLAMVRKSSVAVPSAQGKSLRQALGDVAATGRSEPETGVAHTLVLAGRPAYVFKVDAWSGLLRASRAALYVEAFLEDVRASGRVPFFARAADYPAVGLALGRGVRGASRSLAGIYTARAVAAEVTPALVAFDPTLDGAALPIAERAALTRLVQEELSRYATSYRTALWDYATSFRFDFTSVASLRVDLEDMVGPASWFTDFLLTVADNARVESDGNLYLEPLVQALTTLSPLVSVMAGEKGKYPLLEKYYAVVSPLIASLDSSAPTLASAPGAPLEDRVGPLGKLGLALLDVEKPAPLPSVQAWLDGVRLLDRSLRAPFLAPIQFCYEQAIQSVEKALEQAYRNEVRPLVAPLLTRFPFDPRADVDAGPEELLTALGPQGTFRVGIDGLLAPVCKKSPTIACLPKAPLSYRAVKVSPEAIELGSWSAQLARILWDDGGKPKPLALQARPRALPEVRRGDLVVATLSYLRSGESTVYAFNQVPSWQPLPVAWSTSSPAAVGVDRVDAASSDKLVLSTEGEGSLWRFHRLLCKGQQAGDGSVTWPLETPVTYDLQPDPWKLVLPPGSRGRSCALLVAGK